LKLNSHLPKGNGVFPIPMHKIPLFRKTPIEVEPCQDKEEEVKTSSSQTFEHHSIEEAPIFIHQVENVGSKHGDITPFYITLQINDASLHNCVLHPNASNNIMTEEIMQQLGLSLSQSNTRGGFAKGIIKELEVAFLLLPKHPFLHRCDSRRCRKQLGSHPQQRSHETLGRKFSRQRI
jgi:hypothetical protein